MRRKNAWLRTNIHTTSHTLSLPLPSLLLLPPPKQEPVLQEVKDAYAKMNKGMAVSVEERMHKLYRMRGNLKGVTFKSSEPTILDNLYNKFFTPARTRQIDVPPFGGSCGGWG